MVKKLYEIASLKTVKFNFEVEEEIRELSLSRFTVGKLAAVAEDGDIDKLFVELQVKPMSWSPKIGWELLVEKEEFNFDFKVFMDLLTVKNLQKLCDAVNQTVQDGLLIEKNAEGTEMK